jgi:hypothetical protein
MSKERILLGVLAAVVVCAGGGICFGEVITVNWDGSGDYTTIQAAIDDANYLDTVIVEPGTYYENITFGGKNIIVTSTKPYDGSVVGETEIDGGGLGTVVTFSGGETESCLLTGFSITGGNADKGGGIYCSGSSPTITHCRIYNNLSTNNYGGGGIHCFNGNLTVTYCIIEGNTGGFGGGLCGEETGTALVGNCIIAGNWARGFTFGGLTQQGSGGGAACFHGYILVLTNCTISSNWAYRPPAPSGSAGGGGVCVYDLESAAIIKNSILWGNYASPPKEIRGVASVSYSDVEGGYEGDFNIDSDPLFKDPGVLDFTNEWYPGDFHLKSQAGRWDTAGESWVQDDVTSPGIDAGDPDDPVGYELFPNGGIVNMGAYGGTYEGSKSYFGGPVCDTHFAGDINGDCRIDLLDFYFITLHWLEGHNP